MTDKSEATPKSPLAQRFEYIGWAVFLLGLGLAALFRDADLGEWWIVAAAAAMALYVGAGLILRYRVSLVLIFFAVILAVLAASRFTDRTVELILAALIAGGIVVLVKAFRPERSPTA
jgi:uncharacterized membrane protein YjjP (DUF1212 family)